MAGYQPGDQTTLYRAAARPARALRQGTRPCAIAELVAGSEEAFVGHDERRRRRSWASPDTHFASSRRTLRRGRPLNRPLPTSSPWHAVRDAAAPVARASWGRRRSTISVSGVPDDVRARPTPCSPPTPARSGVKTGYTAGAGRAFVGVREPRRRDGLRSCVLGTRLGGAAAGQDTDGPCSTGRTRKHREEAEHRLVRRARTLGYACERRTASGCVRRRSRGQATPPSLTAPRRSAASGLAASRHRELRGMDGRSTSARRGRSAGSIAWTRRGRLRRVVGVASEAPPTAIVRPSQTYRAFRVG